MKKFKILIFLRPGVYEWTCTLDDVKLCPKIPPDYLWWSSGMPEQANKDWRCVYALFRLATEKNNEKLFKKSSTFLPGDFGRDGKWVKAACSDNNVFICEVKESLFKRDCDTGWLLFGDKCYRYTVTIFRSLMFLKYFQIF